MFLTATEIEGYVQSGELLIEPFSSNQLKPVSCVLHLSNRWRKWTASSEPIDLYDTQASDCSFTPIFTSEEQILSKGEFLLGATVERIKLPSDIVAIITPLSHIARWGLCVNFGSMFVSPGFGVACRTALTLELASFNQSPLILRNGLPICHLAFIKVKKDNKSYPLKQSVYDGRETPIGSLLNEECKIFME